MNPLSTHTNLTKKTPALGIFILASVLLHIGLIGVSFPPHAIPATPNNNAPLNVTIQDRIKDVGAVARATAHAPSQTQQQTQTALVRPIAPAAVRTAKPVKRDARASAVSSTRQHQEPTEIQTDATPAAGQTIAPSDAMASSTTESRPTADIASESATGLKVIAREIVSLMESFRRFPPLARQRGWEGEVLLSFRLNQLGVIDNIQVAHGSGFAILDQNAVDTLRRVGNIEKSAPWLPRNAINVSLPVVYTLTEG